MRFLILLLLALCAGCASPSLQRPTISQSDKVDSCKITAVDPCTSQKITKDAPSIGTSQSQFVPQVTITSTAEGQLVQLGPQITNELLKKLEGFFDRPLKGGQSGAELARDELEQLRNDPSRPLTDRNSPTKAVLVPTSADQQHLT